MPKAPEGFHKCADGKTIRKKIDTSERRPNVRANALRDQRRQAALKPRLSRAGRGFNWVGTGSSAYSRLPWWSKIIYRLKAYFSEHAQNRRKHKALYKKAGRIKPSSQHTTRPIARREQHK